MAYILSDTCMLVNIGLTRSECASWVQAWASVGAIVAAAFAVLFSHYLQHRQRWRDDYDAFTRYLEAVYQLVGGSYQTMVKIYDLETNVRRATPDERRSMYVQLESFKDAFQRIDLTRLDQWELVEAVMVSDAVVRKLISAIEHVGKSTTSQQLDGNYVATSAEEAIKELEARANTFIQIIAARGGKSISISSLN